MMSRLINSAIDFVAGAVFLALVCAAIVIVGNGVS